MDPPPAAVGDDDTVRGAAFAANGMDAWSEGEGLVMPDRHLFGGPAKSFGRAHSADMT